MSLGLKVPGVPPGQDVERFHQEWIKAQALHAPVATAQQEVAAGETPWSTDMVIGLADVYCEYITGVHDV